MRKLGLLLLSFSVLSLGGCMRAMGPCYGVGCHAFAAPQPAAAPQATVSQNALLQRTEAAVRGRN